MMMRIRLHHNKAFTNKAFTLIEIIIGITVLTIVLVALGIITFTSIRANQANIQNLTAYYLAQEGLEGIRSIRDSNWLQNHAWNDGGDRFWGEDFNQDTLVLGGQYGGFYLIDYQPYAPISPSDESEWAPWRVELLEKTGCDPQLTELPEPTSPTKSQAQLYRVTDSSGYSYYLHDSGVDVDGDPDEVAYGRYVLLCYPDPDDDIVEATSVVFWTDRGLDHTIEVSTEFTDWRDGPL